jgi:hypothetical protein
VSSLVDISQVVDTFVGHWIDGGSGALQFHWVDATGRLQVDWVRWDYMSCTEDMLVKGNCVPFFDQDGFLFTIGYGVILLIFLPMALMDLKVSSSTFLLPKATRPQAKREFSHQLVNYSFRTNHGLFPTNY